MPLGFQQLLLILYVLVLAVGPKRIVRWVRRGQALGARFQRKPAPEPGRFDLLRLVELTEHSSPFGWALAVLGLGAALAGYFAPGLGIPGYGSSILYVGATLMMFVALLLV